MRKIFMISVFGMVAAMAQESGPLVSTPAVTGVSDSLERIARRGKANAFTVREFTVSRNHDIPKAKVSPSGFVPAPYVTVSATAPYTQTATYLPLGAPIGVNFGALGVGTPGFTVTSAPPDTTLGVSSTQIVQWVNIQLAVYDKIGTPLLAAPGFIDGNAIWAGLPGGSLCRTYGSSGESVGNIPSAMVARERRTPHEQGLR